MRPIHLASRFAHAIAAASTVAALAAASVAVHAQPAPEGAVEPVKVKAVTRFAFARAALGAEDQAAILAEVGQMKDVTWQTVTATGFTDSVGPAEVNRKLSIARADAVKRYLVGKGLAPDMISTAGKAEEQPVASNDTAEGRAQNRRTEIEFRGVRAPVPR